MDRLMVGRRAGSSSSFVRLPVARTAQPPLITFKFGNFERSGCLSLAVCAHDALQ